MKCVSPTAVPHHSGAVSSGAVEMGRKCGQLLRVKCGIVGAVAVSWGRAGKQVGWCHMCHPHPLLAVRPEKIPNKNTTTNQPHLSFTPHCLSMKGNWILWFIISSRLNDQLPVDTICEICLTSDIIFVKDMIQICDEPLIWRKILSIMRSNWSEGALQMSNCLVNLRNLVFF